MNTTIAATYVINLPGSTDRWRDMQPLLEATGLANIVRFPAIDGRKISAEEIRHMQATESLESDLSAFNRDCLGGEIGCALSHRAVLADIIRNGWPTALILEDDVVLAGSPGTWQTRFTQCFSDLPGDWELWYLYRCFDVRHRIERVTPRTLIPWTPQGGAAYAVTLAGARKLMAALTPLASAVDRVYADLVRGKTIRAFAASPRLILPGSHKSIIHRENPKGRWMKNGVNAPPEYWPRECLAYIGEHRTPLLSLPQPFERARNEIRTAAPVRCVWLVVWWFARAGGLERHITDVALALNRRGVEVRVFSEMPVSPTNVYVRELRQAGIVVDASPQWLGLIDRIGKWNWRHLRSLLQRLLTALHRVRCTVEKRLDGHGWTERETEILGKHSFNPLTRHLLRSLSTCSASSAPDVIHLHGIRFGQMWVLEWAAARGYPSVYTEHSTISDWGGPFEPDAPAIAARNGDVLSCVSETSRTSMLAELPATCSVEVLRHIVPASPRPVVSIQKASKILRLVCVARLARHKGIDVLLEAMAILRHDEVSVQLLIAGEGPERSALERLSEQRGVGSAITFLGNVDHSRIPELWQTADIAVLPSRTEGLPLAALEAMAHSIPVVATRVGGIPEVIRDGENGLLVESGDASALAQALKRLATNPALSRRLGAAARATVADGGWSETDVTRRLISIYERAREKRRASESVKHDQPHRDVLKLQDLAWVQGQLAVAADVQRICVFLWSLNRFGEMEELITGQVCALAWAGVEVHVFVAMPAYFNRYVRRMRGAGARVVHPSIADSLAIRLALPSMGNRVPSRASRRALAALDRHCFSKSPDILHVHGWRLGTTWILPEARARGIDAVYSEHADDSSSPLAAVRLRALDTAVASSASPSAIRWFRAIAGDAEPLFVTGRKESEPSKISTGAMPEIAAIAGPGEHDALAQEFERVRTVFPNLRLRLIPPDLNSGTLVIALASARIVLLSSKSSMFPVALITAMAAGKPLVICGRTGAAPVIDRVNCLAADFALPMSVAEALKELLTDAILAQNLGAAARGKAAAVGARNFAIACEAGSLYRRARARVMNAEVEAHAVG